MICLCCNFVSGKLFVQFAVLHFITKLFIAVDTSGVASPKIWGAKKFGGSQNV